VHPKKNGRKSGHHSWTAPSHPFFSATNKLGPKSLGCPLVQDGGFPQRWGNPGLILIICLTEPVTSRSRGGIPTFCGSFIYPRLVISPFAEIAIPHEYISKGEGMH